jgi:hypothetical protein
MSLDATSLHWMRDVNQGNFFAVYDFPHIDCNSPTATLTMRQAMKVSVCRILASAAEGLRVLVKEHQVQSSLAMVNGATFGATGRKKSIKNQ